jgi:ribulose-phosphate 3-epimerase
VIDHAPVPAYIGRRLGFAVPWRQWVRTVEIEPSLYAADFSRLGEQIEVLLRAGARVFHFDVGDGHFVPPVTMGPIVLKWIAPMILDHEGAIDCHLMVENPERHFEAIREAGGSSVTFHYEACDDPPAVAALAREQGLEVGLAFNPRTSPEDAARAAVGFDVILCMSINPGYSGQQFMPEAFGRVRALRKLLPDDVYVQVDGGVGPDNVRELYLSGANLLVAGTSIFAREDLPRAYRRLVQALA